jgi:hypothetical protein
MVPRHGFVPSWFAQLIGYSHGVLYWEDSMFFRTKVSGPRAYLQVVENRWEAGRSRQRVVATLAHV